MHFSSISANMTLLEEVNEGDMLLDEKDLNIMNKSVHENKKEEAKFLDEDGDDDDFNANDDFGSSVLGK